jgi:RimJ/RimL family protein N-acetyltransferase
MAENTAGDTLFFMRTSLEPAQPTPLSLEYRAVFWQPGWTGLFPPGVWDPRLLAYGLMAVAGVLDRRHYGMLTILDSRGQIAHRSFLMPKFARFPFMAVDDLQIGAVQTTPAFRGKGLAPLALAWMVEHFSQPGRRFWYLTASDNGASIAAATKAGFVLAGRGCKRPRLGLQFLGYYDIGVREEAL